MIFLLNFLVDWFAQKKKISLPPPKKKTKNKNKTKQKKTTTRGGATGSALYLRPNATATHTSRMHE
jgi:hypothetical protein